MLPGPTRSEEVAALVEQLARQRGVSFEQVEEEYFKIQRPASLLQRFATVDEVANTVVYLCSPAASATTDAAIRSLLKPSPGAFARLPPRGGPESARLARWVVAWTRLVAPGTGLP